MALYEWQEKVIKDLKNGYNVAVNASAGSGKTLPGMLYADYLYHNTNKTIFWLVPYKSLAIDKYNEVKDKYDAGILTGEFKHNTNARFIVAIYESFMNNFPKYQNRIGFVVCDEIHTIRERDNIDRTFKLIRQYNIQYYAITATFKDLKYYCYDAKYYHVDNLGYTLPRRVIRISNQLINSTFLIRKHIEQNDNILVFMFSIDRIRKTVESIYTKFTKITIDRNVIENIKDDLLRKTITHGIAFYTSDLPKEDKFIVAELFNKKIIKCIFCTDSIATGVNLPCDVIILREIRKFDKDNVDYLDENLLIQLYGRAGRKGKSNKAIIYIPSNSPTYYSNPKQKNIMDVFDRFFNRLRAKL